MGSDFFISYTQADRPWAEWIAWQLRAAGHTVTLQAWHFGPGADFIAMMQQALSRGCRLIAVVSRAFFKSRFTQAEWGPVFASDPDGSKRLLIPVRIAECELEGLLRTRVYIDLVGLDRQHARRVLLDGVGPGGPPGTEPPFPAELERSQPAEPRFPTELPPIWNIPLLRNPNFVGRDQLLEDLGAGFGERMVQVLTGLGGIGKTQVAIEYAYRFQAHYDLVWWLDAADPIGLARAMASLAEKLDLPVKERASEDVIEATRRGLERRQRWLLLFDNAEDAQSIERAVPRGGGGHVLITSRNYLEWGSIGTSLELGALSVNDAEKLLRLRAPSEKNKRMAREQARELAQELGLLPLALEQAGAYVEAGGISFAKYLAEFKKQNTRLLGSRGAPAGKERTVATTWNLSFERLSQEAPASAELLYLFSFLSPDEIPREILSPERGLLPPFLAQRLSGDVELTDAILALRKYSLVQLREGNPTVHRLVQRVVRERLGAEQQRTWAEAAARLVDAAFPSATGHLGFWPEADLLLSHARAVLALQDSLPSEVCARLNEKVASYLSDRGDVRNARPHLEQSLALFQKSHGASLDEARVLNKLGVLMRRLGRYPDALVLHQRALKLLGNSEQERREEALAYTHLGRLYRKAGDTAQALEYHQKAIALYEAHHWRSDADMLDLATALDSLGSTLRDLNQPREAQRNFQRALELRQSVHQSETHPSIAWSLDNLALVLRDLKDFRGALALHEKALALYEGSYGDKHPYYAWCLENLGTTRRELGDLQGAVADHQRALDLYIAVRGEDHPDAAHVKMSLAADLEQQGTREEAIRLLQEALAVFERTLEPGHRLVRHVREELARLGA